VALALSRSMLTMMSLHVWKKNYSSEVLTMEPIEIYFLGSPGPTIQELSDDDVPELFPTIQRPARSSPRSPVPYRRQIPIQNRQAAAQPFVVDDDEAEFTPPRGEDANHDSEMQEALKQSLEESERALRKQERDELEAAYQESLAVDRQKEQAAQAEQRKRYEEERKKQEEERKKEKTKSAAEEEKDLYVQLRNDLAQKAGSLPEEPAADDTDAITVAGKRGERERKKERERGRESERERERARERETEGERERGRQR
jgi:hypothetical protein